MADAITPEDEATLVMDWLAGEDDEVTRASNSYPVAGSQWYLVSTTWLNAWKAYLGVSPAAFTEVKPGAIDNTELLLEGDYVRPNEKGQDVKITKPSLICNRDYELCPPVCWRFLSQKYDVKPGSEIIRQSISNQDNTTRVEVSLKPVKFTALRFKDPLLTDPKIIYISCKSSQKSLRDNLLKHINALTRKSYTASQICLWKLDPTKSLLDLKRFIDKYSTGIEASLEFPGNILKDALIEDCEIAGENDLVVCEIKGSKRVSYFSTFYCCYCNKLAGKKFSCMCEQSCYYCSKNCLEKDQSHHVCKQPTPPELPIEEPSNTEDKGNGQLPYKIFKKPSAPQTYTATPKGPPKSYHNGRLKATLLAKDEPSSTVRQSPSQTAYYQPSLRAPLDSSSIKRGRREAYKTNKISRRGLTGLQNLGNTCFMNSGLQCLSNSWPLVKYFLDNSYQKDLNRTNPLGTKGALAEKFGDLIKEMWLEESPSYSPWEFKRVLSTFASQFSGNAQHDSQELISFTLDGLHEDLNRVIDKPYGQDLSFVQGLSDPEAAQLHWADFLQRNQSIIVDNMYGQYRSEVTCPKCSTVSKTFDPFNMLTVSIPYKNYEIIDVIFVQRKLTKLSLKFPKSPSVLQVKERLAEVFAISPATLVVGYCRSLTLVSSLSDDREVAGLFKHEDLVVYQRVVGDPLVINFMKDIRYTFHTRKVPACHSRIIPINFKMTLEELYLELYWIIGLGQDRGLTSDEIRSKFKAAFPSLFSKTGNDYFKLNYVNGHCQQDWKSSASFFTKPQESLLKPCDFCRIKTCQNCKVPFTDKLSFESVASLVTFESDLRLEIVLSEHAEDAIRELTQVQLHPSVEELAQSESKQMQSTLSIEECLEFSSQPEELDASNTSYCAVCKEHVQAYKKMELYKLPKVLIMHLKRFKIHDYFGVKIDKTITFPIQALDMSRFVKALGEGPQLYDLTGVSNHFGMIGSGHYTAFCKNPETQSWNHFDDNKVIPIDENLTSKIVTNAAYVLFYERRE